MQNKSVVGKRMFSICFSLLNGKPSCVPEGSVLDAKYYGRVDTDFI